MKEIGLLVLVILSVCNVTTIQITPKVIGGSNADIAKYPHQISVRYYGTHICGGSIIAETWALTAAHCLDWFPEKSLITFRAGSSDQTSGGSLHNTKSYAIHPDHVIDKHQFDVAVVQVMEPFSGKKAIPIPLAKTEWIEGSLATITGWGYTAPGSGVIPAILQVVEMPVIGRITCNSIWGSGITDDMICAGISGRDACAGDSGGPIIQNGSQYGIMSWGSTKCGDGLPHVFTNLIYPSIRDFIRKQTGV